MTSARYRDLQPGDPAPWFTQRCTSNERYAFDTVAGRYIVLCFFGSAGHVSGQARLGQVLQLRPRFDDQRLTFFGVSVDPADEASDRLQEALPGIRHFWDATAGSAASSEHCRPRPAGTTRRSTARAG